MSTHTTMRVEMRKNGKWVGKNIYSINNDGGMDIVQPSCGSGMRDLLKFLSNNLEHSLYPSNSVSPPVDISSEILEEYENDKTKYSGIYGFNYFTLETINHCDKLLQSLKSNYKQECKINFLTQLVQRCNLNDGIDTSNIVVNKESVIDSIDNGWLIEDDGFEYSLNTLRGFINILSYEYMSEYKNDDDIRIYYWFS